jgi:hypothetical protein
MLTIWGRVPDVEESVARLDAVTTDDVRRFAGAMQGARVALALYGPVAVAPGLEAIRAGLTG